MLRYAALTAALLLAGTASADDLLQEARATFAPIPTRAPAPRDNPVTPKKVELGRMLFFEPRLSASGLLSCNTCHNVGMGGGDNLETSVGHGWHKGPRNAPTVLNAVFNVAQFWDGRAADLKAQAKGPIQTAVEMNATPERVVATLKSMPEYVRWFAQAFPQWSLKQAVAIMGTSQLGERLATPEVDAVVAFLGTLTGTQPRVEYPLLPVSTETTPRPEPMAR